MPATTGSIKAGRAFILIEAVDATGKVMTAIGNKLKSWGRSMMMTGMGMAFQSFLAGSGVALATKTFMSFDDAMRRVQARSEGTAEQLADLRKQAIDLSKASALSAIDIANLMAELAQMGFNRGQIAQMADPINLLAQAGGTGNKALDAINAAKLVASTIRSMHKDYSEAAHVADVFAQALNLSSMALEDASTAMAYAGPIAYRYKVSLEDTVSVLGYLRNLEIDAETAGTGFRNMLLEMSESKGREKFNKMLEEFTGKTIEFVDEAGNLKKITDLLFALGETMKGLGTAQQGELLFTLFGKRAIIPSSALMEGKNAFEGIRAMMEDIEGVAKQMKDTMEGGLGGAWRRLRNSTIATAIAIGDALDPALRAVGESFKRLTDNFTNWVLMNRRVVVAVVSAIAAWGAFGITLLLVGLGLIFIGKAIVLVGTLVGAVSLLATPLALVAMELATIAAFVKEPIFKELSEHSDLFAGSLTDLKQSIVDFGNRFLEVKDLMLEGFKSVIDLVSEGELELAFMLMTDTITVAWLKVIDMMKDSWGEFVDFFAMWSASITSTLRELQLGLAGLVMLGTDAARVVMETVYPNAEDEPGKHTPRDVIDSLKEYSRTLAQDIARAQAENDKGGTEFNEARKAREEANKARAAEIKAAEARLAETKAMIEYLRNPETGFGEEVIPDDSLPPGGFPIPDDIIGIAEGASGLATELKEGLLKGTVEAAKAAYESVMSPQEANKKVEEQQLEAIKSVERAVATGLAEIAAIIGGV